MIFHSNANLLRYHVVLAVRESKRIYTVTPDGLRTARDLHRVRQQIWNAIAEGGRS